jgi:hypothetical protein
MHLHKTLEQLEAADRVLMAMQNSYLSKSAYVPHLKPEKQIHFNKKKVLH